MSIGRRAFLQFAAGAVGGTLLSPLPWKLIDDSAIWSQNWSFRPSPERGPVTWKPTICLFCDAGCGIKAKLVNGNRVIHIEGTPDHPANRGGVCPLAAAGAQFLYAPYRIPKPLKQTKKRGDVSGFQAISWSDAIGEIAAKLAKLRADGKPQAVAAVTAKDRGGMAVLFRRFLTAYGSPNLYTTPSCADSMKAAASLALGQSASFAFALETAGYVLSFGAPLLEGWGSPCRSRAAYGMWHATSKPTARLVQVDTRCSMTASKADRWVAVAPGTEAALALGIAAVMVKENLFDAAFVSANVFGFEDWTDASGKSRKGFKSLLLSPEYSPEETAKKTGIDAGAVKDLAREFGSARDAVAIWGEAQGENPGNVYDDLAFFALNVLKGNLKPGGTFSLVPAAPFPALPEVALDDIAKKGLEQPRPDAAKNKTPLAVPSLTGLFEALAAGGPAVEVLMVHEANPAYTLAGTKVFRDALTKIGTLVSFSSYLDETAALADFVLPNPMALERVDDVEGLPGAPYAYYAVSAPVLKPAKDNKPTGDVLIELAGKIGGSVPAALPWKTYEAFLKERVKGLAASGKGAVADAKTPKPWTLKAGDAVASNYKDGDDLWKKLSAGACWVDAPVDAVKGAATPSGKVELACQALLAKGLAGDDAAYLPHAAMLPLAGDGKDFPLLLRTYRTQGLNDGFLANPPFMTKTLFDWTLKEDNGFVQVNAQTASALGLQEGAPATVKTASGEAKVLVHVSPTVPPNTVYAVLGLGHQAYDEYIAKKGINPNDLIEVQVDPVTGLGTVWATRAQLRRA